MVEHQIDVRAGGDGRQAFKEFVWREDQMAGAVVPRVSEGADDAAVGEARQSLLRERGAQKVSTESFESEPVIGADIAIGVKIKPLQMRVPRADGPHPRGVGVAPDAQYGRAGTVAECRATADGGGAQLGEHRRIGGNWIRLDILAVRRQHAATP